MSKEIRRKVLKGLAVGAPVAWSKPMVDSVLLPAHAETSCQVCFTISIIGADGNGDDGGAEFIISDPDNACQIIAQDRYDGDAGTQETICITVPNGRFGLLMTAGAADGAQATISVECCSASEILGPTSDGGMFYDLIIGGDSAPCAIEDPTGCLP